MKERGVGPAERLGFAHDVFLSYYDKEQGEVFDSLLQRLKLLDLEVFNQKRDLAGATVNLAAMQQHVSGSRLVLALLSPNYFTSKWCRGELEAAHAAGVPIVPCFSGEHYVRKNILALNDRSDAETAAAVNAAFGENLIDVNNGDHSDQVTSDLKEKIVGRFFGTSADSSSARPKHTRLASAVVMLKRMGSGLTGSKKSDDDARSIRGDGLLTKSGKLLARLGSSRSGKLGRADSTERAPGEAAAAVAPTSITLEVPKPLGAQTMGRSGQIFSAELGGGSSSQPPREPSTTPDNKFRPELPTFVFGKRDLYEDSIVDRVGQLSHSVQQEFEDNEGGRWLCELQYVTEQPAVQTYPSTKGIAFSDDLVPSHTRDLNHEGKTLQWFVERQPSVGSGPGQIREALTNAEIVVLRMYTGPWFEAINFFLRYRPEVMCCDPTPYFEPLRDKTKDEGVRKPHNARRCFLADPKREGVCIQCGKPESEHTRQELQSWATSAALLVSGILKLRVASAPATVYRGVKEQFIQLPEGFVTKRAGQFASGVEPAPMSTTKERGVALSYAGEQRGSLFQIEFTDANRGAALQFLSQYPAEEELVFPPGTMLTCMGEDALTEHPNTRLLRIDCANNPDNQVKKAVESLLTHRTTPGQTTLRPVYILAVAQPPPVLLGHVKNQVEYQHKLVCAKTSLVKRGPDAAKSSSEAWGVAGRWPVCLQSAEASEVLPHLVRSQTHCLVWLGQGYEETSCTSPAPLTVGALADAVRDLPKVSRPTVAFVAV